MAWLHATPKGQDKTRMAKFKALDENHSALTMPDLEEHSASYVIGLLQEAGLMSSNGMGPVPLSWVEIESWMKCTGLELTTWERLVVKHLSDEYVSELVQATDPQRMMPFNYSAIMEEKDLAAEREAVVNKLSGFAARWNAARANN